MTELESHLLVDPLVDEYARASVYSFGMGVFASADNVNWTDITQLTHTIGPIWYGIVSDNVYGWSFQVSGIGYNSALLSPGCYVRLSRSITTPGSSDAQESWMKGRILPSPVEFSYLSAAWNVLVVDDITYLARKKAPVFSVGTQNLATSASVEADSDVEATVVLGEGEFYGFPELTPEKAVDNDLNSLWISSKSPDPSFTVSYFPWSNNDVDKSVVLNEFYYKGYSPTSNQDQWFEVVTADSSADPQTFHMLTRTGGLRVVSVPFARPTNLPNPNIPQNSKNALYAILTYDAGRFERTWGTPVDVPVFEYKNAREQFLGSVEPDVFGFNADGEGDFFAICPGGDIVNGAWRVYAVVDGPKMRRFDFGYFNEEVDEAQVPFSIRLTKQWAQNELVGCFIRDTNFSDDNNHYLKYNCCRRIKSNSASGALSGGYYDTTITVDGGWEDRASIPHTNDSLIIRPWPEYYQTRYGNHSEFLARDARGWLPSDSLNYADYHMLTDVGIGTTWRKSKDGWHKTYIGDDDGGSQLWEWTSWQTWMRDGTPSPGPSSGYGDYSSSPNDDWMVDKYFPWIKVSPPRFSVLTSSNIENGDMVINVHSSDGLLQSYPDLIVPEPIKSLFVAGTSSEVRYTAKAATMITLESPWSQGIVPINTAVYQFEDGVYTDVWPIQFIVIKRRRVPAYNGTDLRVIKKLHVYVSYQDDPIGPDGDHWREAWDSASNPTNPNGVPVFTVSSNSTDDIITFQFLNGGALGFTRNHSRIKHALISIREMLDLSRGRVNEIELIPPSDTVQGLQNSTVAEFFSYILEQVGIPLANIQTGTASTDLLGSFSTDTSAYIELLSDLATRTGQIVWSGPNLQARVQNHPNWPSSPVMVSWLTIDNESASALSVMPYTGYPISQLQVTVRDADGNTAVGLYPSSPLSVGEIVVEPTIRSADTNQANNIARMLFNEISLAKLKVTISGLAPWVRPGAYRVDVNYTLPNGQVVTGPYYISAIDHVFELGGVNAPRTWITDLELTKIVGAS